MKTIRGHRLGSNLTGLWAFGLRPALLLTLLLALCARGIAVAQDVVEVEPVVGDIQIEFVDLKTVSREAILSRIQIRPGMQYDQQMVDRSIRTLYGMRLFDFIEARTEEMFR